MQTLWLAGTQITDIGLKELKNLKGLQMLWLEPDTDYGRRPEGTEETYSSLSLGMGAAGLRTRRVSAFSAVGTETHRATPSIPNVKTP